jgi:multiple sugar transport system substrate-binding protein
MSARVTVARVSALVFLLLVAACDRHDDGQTVLRFWAMGREGELVEELVRDFESANPDIRIEVQQIPWSAAHEKLLTAFVGGSTPDLAQLGNTWIAEFVALQALEPLSSRIAASPAVEQTSYFDGIWDTNVIDGEPYGIPWYVDTRVLFYRRDILAAAGYDSMPGSWREWRAALHAVKSHVGPDRYAIFLPVNEWTQPVILGLQTGSPLLAANATRGAFGESAFASAFDFYNELFREKLAPPVSNNEISNLYQEFARGYFAMVVTGPWNLGEFRRRLPAELADAWSVAPLPGPGGAAAGVSLAGGASLVLFRRSEHHEAAWKLIEFLSDPEQQRRFYEMSGDLPARREAWQGTALLDDPRTRAFWEQLQRVRATPKIPEWEQIAYRVQERAEAAVRGRMSNEEALRVLDDEVDRILEKRRWLLEREAGRPRSSVPPAADDGGAT